MSQKIGKLTAERIPGRGQSIEGKWEPTRQGDGYGRDRCGCCLMSLSLAWCPDSKTRRLNSDRLFKQLIVIIISSNINFVYFHSTSPHLLPTDCQERDTQRRPANCCSFNTSRKHKPLLKITGCARSTLWLSSLGETYCMCQMGAHRAESELGTSKELSFLFLDNHEHYLNTFDTPSVVCLSCGFPGCRGAEKIEPE